MSEFAHTTRRIAPTTGSTTSRAPAAPAQRRAHATDRIASVLQLRHILARSPQVAQLARTAAILQRDTMPEDELVQAKRAPVAQREGVEEEPIHQRTAERVPNRTGMPDELKAGIETLSGLDLSDVRVHANSTRPATLNARAYASGNEIHLAPGQEEHLPHEAWHVVQQRQGRVPPTTEVAGVAVNDDVSLEAEADAMGVRAMQFVVQRRTASLGSTPVVQRREWYAYGSANTTPHIHCYNSGCHLKDAYGERYDLVKDNYRNDQSVINQAFDAIRAQYPQPTNSVRVGVLQAMRDILRNTPVRPKKN